MSLLPESELANLVVCKVDAVVRVVFFVILVFAVVLADLYDVVLRLEEITGVVGQLLEMKFIAEAKQQQFGFTTH